MLFKKSKKIDLREVSILYQIEGHDSTLTISHFVTDLDNESSLTEKSAPYR